MHLSQETGSNASIGEIIEASKQEREQSQYGMPYGAPSAYGAASTRDFSPQRYGGGGGGMGTVGHYAAPSVGSLPRGAAASVYGGSAYPASVNPYAQPGAMSTFAGAGKRDSTTSFFAANALAQAGMLPAGHRSSSGDLLGGGGVYNASPRAMSPVGEGERQGVPPDEVIVHDVQEMLATADLQTVTKKTVRTALAQRYGVDDFSADKKALINAVISETLGLA